MNFLANKRNIHSNSPKQTSNNNITSISNDKCLHSKKMIVNNSNPSLIGMLLGPKGSFLKSIEFQTKCKIGLRGKGTNRESKTSDEPFYILITSDNKEAIQSAELKLTEIINASDTLKSKIKEEQKAISKIIYSEKDNTDINKELNDLHNISPYGKPSSKSHTINIPESSVGLLIGKNGETIKSIIKLTGCKVHIGLNKVPNTEIRNIFIEGENYKEAVSQIINIISHHEKFKLQNQYIGNINPNRGPFYLFLIPDAYLGLIIGKNGETIKSISETNNITMFALSKSREYYNEMFKVINIVGKDKFISFTGKPLFHEIIDKINSSDYNESRLEVNPSIYSYSVSDILTICNVINYKILKSKIIIRDYSQYKVIEMTGNEIDVNKAYDEIQNLINKKESFTSEEKVLNYPSLHLTKSNKIKNQQLFQN